MTRHPITRPLVLSLFSLLGCATVVEPPAPSEVGYWRGADTGIERRELRAVARGYFEGWTSWHPDRATALGDPAQLGRWPSTNDAIRGRWENGVWEVAAGLALIQPEQLSEPDRLTAAQLTFALERERTLLETEIDRWLIDPVDAPHMRFLAASATQPALTGRQREQLLDRWAAFARSVRELDIDASGMARAGFVAPRSSIERNIAQIDAILAAPTLEHPFLQPAAGDGRWTDLAADENVAALAKRELGDPLRQDEILALNLHLRDPEVRSGGTRVLLPSPSDSLTPAERGRFMADVRAVIDEQIRPALSAWRETLAFDLALRAPSDERPGLVDRPGGIALYQQLAWLATTARLAPTTVAEQAQAELEELESRMYALAAGVLGVAEADRIQALMRGDQRRFHPNVSAVEASLRVDLARADRVLAQWFLDVPRRALVVGAFERPEGELGARLEYQPPTVDSSRPARLVLDVSDDRQPINGTAAAAFGEGVPGRHFLDAILRDRMELPLFRRYTSSTVLEEGWVDYAEGLADEMGLYADDAERVEWLARAVLRRARAVADVGLHFEGWSRADAVDFLRRHSFLSPIEVDNEVDLLLGRPASSLAAVVAAAAIRDLRGAAEVQRGDDFDVREFHAALTANGPLDLATLATLVGEELGFDGRAATGL
jgi:uncharacterized protein (DUF885 family)